MEDETMRSLSGVQTYGRTMIIQGEGKVSAIPDVAAVIIGVQADGADIGSMQEENNIKMARIIEAMIQQGVPRERIRTAEYRLFPQYDYEGGQQIFKGYRLIHTIKVEVQEAEKAGALIDSAVQHGANIVSDITFSVSSPETLYTRALTLALQNAQQKAAAVAAYLNIHIYPIPYKIEEISPAQVVPYQTSGFIKAEGTPLEPGLIQFESVVRVLFHY